MATTSSSFSAKKYKNDNGWPDFKTVVQCNRYMLTEGLGCDVVFLVGQSGDQEVFNAHKYVLASRSMVFFQMFFGTVGQDTRSKVDVPDIRPGAFKILLM